MTKQDHDHEETGWQSPGIRLEKVEERVECIDRKGCRLHQSLDQGVKFVKVLGYAMLTMQVAVLIGILSLVLK